MVLVLSTVFHFKPSSLTLHMVNLPRGWYPHTRSFFATLHKPHPNCTTLHFWHCMSVTMYSSKPSRIEIFFKYIDYVKYKLANLSIMPSICFLISCALLKDLACMKFSKHHGLENLLFFQELYTASRVIWSPSPWWNFAFFWSARACFSWHIQEQWYLYLCKFCTLALICTHSEEHEWRVTQSLWRINSRR